MVLHEVVGVTQDLVVLIIQDQKVIKVPQVMVQSDLKVIEVLKVLKVHRL